MGAKALIAFLLTLYVCSVTGSTPLTREELTDIRARCPSRNGQFPVYVAHPRSCGEFFVCDFGVPTWHSCPHGLHFNTKINVCDFQDRAGCVGGRAVSSGGPGSLRIPPLMMRNSRCPLRNGALPVFLTHETNCGQYYVCDNGKSIWMTCPANLFFNTRNNVCDHPQAVDRCQDRSSAQAPAGYAAAPAVPDVAPAIPDAAPEAAPGKKDPRCPSRNGAMPVFLAHETNCAQYYVCDSGLAILMPCPHHLLFNADKKVCDQPEEVQCAQPAPEPEPIVGYAAAPPAPDAAAAPGKRDPRCPSRNGAMPVFLAHETNCAQYYVCDSGLAILMPCPHHLLFNPDKKVCDQPEEVLCAQPEPQPAPVVGYAAASPAAPGALAAPGKRDPRCPSRNGAMPVFLAHEKDCAQYYVCDSGLAILMPCPHHLLFNTEKKVCDQPEEVLCINAQPRTNSQQGPALAPAYSWMKRDPRCPLRNGAFPTFLSHETNCGQYYVCDWGLAILMHCPPTMGFDEEVRGCSLRRPC